MRNFFLNHFKTPVLALCALAGATLLAGCGGGGGGSSDSEFAGTYRGTYRFSGSSRPLTLTVNRSGSAEMIFDEDTSSEVEMNGRIERSGLINIEDSRRNTSNVIVNTTVSGQIEDDIASGTIRISSPSDPTVFNGTFFTVKNSSSQVQQNQVPEDAPSEPGSRLFDAIEKVR